MLTGKQRSYLKGLAHDLTPLVYIGKQEITENVIKEVDNLLDSRELVKVKLQESCLMDARTAANEVAAATRAEYVQAIGRRFVLYRRAKDPEKRQIILPR